MSDDERNKQIAELAKTLKEGERLLGPTKRPDGTLRKPIRIRAGYTPQDEVPIYQPKPALLKKEMGSAGPPGYDPDADARPKTKSVKRNERKKEKRLQAAVEKDKNEEGGASEDGGKKESVEALSSLVNDLSVEDSTQQVQDVDKRIRALKKKIRLTEALEQRSADQDLKPEQLEKLAKLEDWRRELKQLEDQKTETTVS
ncbi:partner of Y14 and mago-like [Vigna umbellata]|uniref:partner of Y14 and mago-like n=1 Tax=Vigna umbellata TaxID=87088 RepID=UPI001F5E7FBE|nr:partner of Y14 and mago-like [Vigna umbellata]XP_047153527.1 partner of Y14 and mago-like [Vigna umbellata]